MRVAFVGIRRPYKEFDRDYVRFFNKYHLEIPFYFAELGGNDVTVTTLDHSGPYEEFPSGGRFRNLSESDFLSVQEEKYDVIVHWRKFFPELFRKDSLNIMHTCDHTYPSDWIGDTIRAVELGLLYGIDCYPTWHVENLQKELQYRVPEHRFLPGFTFGVDTDIYTPHQQKDPYALLWSSDPGRGLMPAIQLAIQLFQKDKRYRLHVCYPDYVKQFPPINHPAIVMHGNVPNGPKLWDLFGRCGILPYTSSFKEPSSRAFRQAQSAGSLVLYPPDMGSPSRFIKDGVDGFVRPINEWTDLIMKTVENKSLYNSICTSARSTACAENWQVQADRFNERIGKILEERK